MLGPILPSSFSWQSRDSKPGLPGSSPTLKPLTVCWQYGLFAVCNMDKNFRQRQSVKDPIIYLTGSIKEGIGLGLKRGSPILIGGVVEDDLHWIRAAGVFTLEHRQRAYSLQLHFP